MDNDEWQFNSHHLDELEKSNLKATVTSSDPFIARAQEWTCHFSSPDLRLAGRDVKLSYRYKQKNKRGPFVGLTQLVSVNGLGVHSLKAALSDTIMPHPKSMSARRMFLI